MASEVPQGERLPERLCGLLRPAAYGHEVARVELLTTHLSWLLLAGDYTYKIRRPVRYSFVDFSTLARRHHDCLEELRLNRRFAPELYVRVAAITLTDAGARIDGDAEPIEYAVVMHTFDREQTLDRLVERGAVNAEELQAFGASLAEAHVALPVAEARDAAGAVAEVRNATRRNVGELRQLTAVFRNQSEVLGLAGELAREVERRAVVIAARSRAGRVRECHGDLHLSNVVRLRGRLVPFDCLEFEPAFRWTDTAQDLAFLRAELLAQRRQDLANALLNGYLAASGDYQACEVLDLYTADRALVRAKIQALQATHLPGQSAWRSQRQQAYLGVARAALRPRPVVCLAMHGLSGSGKSWLAARLAPHCQACVVRSDLERDRTTGVAAAGRYSRQAVQLTYRRLHECAASVLSGGLNVIVDATYGARSERAALATRCKDLGARLVFIHCHAPHAVLAERIAARGREGRDASEAGVEVLRWQESNAEPIAADEQLQTVRVETDDSVDPAGLAAALARLCPATS